MLLFTFGILAACCKETAENLVKTMATKLNQEEEKDAPGSLAFILECINESKNNNNDFSIKLARTLGACLRIGAIDCHDAVEIDEALVAVLANVLKTNSTAIELVLRTNGIGFCIGLLLN